MHLNSNVIPFHRNPARRPIPTNHVHLADLSSWYDSLFNTLTTAGTQIYETSQQIKATQAAAQAAQAQAQQANAQANLVRTVSQTSGSGTILGLSTTTWLLIAGGLGLVLVVPRMMRGRHRR